MTSLQKSLKGDQIYFVSIQAAHLNTLVETQFDLTIVGTLNDQPITDVVHITNKAPYAHFDLADHSKDLGTAGITINITDDSTKRKFRVIMSPSCPLVVSIPMAVGDPLVLTMQCMNTQDPKKRMVTGMVHTSFMREASISQTPGSTARKISLTPRKTTSFDQSAAAMGLIGSGQAIPSTKKTLLFLEDSQLIAKSTPNSSIIGGIQCAAEVDPLGAVISSRPVANFHEDYLTDLSTKLLGNDGKNRYIGPTSGAFVVCNSKSEMLTSEMGKKTHKKQSLAINLGLLHISTSSLTGPVRIRAKLVDLVFSAATQSAGQGEDREEAAKHSQKAVIAYIGLLEEVSRELFNDTGLTACTLEGKLFKPTGLHGNTGAASIAAAAALSEHGGSGSGGATEGEESCIAVKLYVSLVPSKGEPDSPDHSESEESGSEEGGSPSHKGAGSKDASQVGSRRGSKVQFNQEDQQLDGLGELNTVGKGQKGSKEKLVKQQSVLDYDQLDGEIGVASAGVSRSGSTASLIDAQKRIDSNEPYNVVTKETALPDQLVGSSSMLAVGAHQLASSGSKSLSKSKSSASAHHSVPKLPLGGSASKVGSNATSTASLPHPANESEFLPLKPAGAFGENLDAASVGRIAPSRHKNAAATGVAFAEVVRAELEQKQRMIEELMEDVRTRTEAIQLCGYDIRGLREEQFRLHNKIQALEEEKARRVEEELRADEVTSQVLRYPHLMHELDKPTLIRNMHKLRERVGSLDRDRSAMEDALKQAKYVIVQFTALKKEHANLQGAHLEQTKYLQKMTAKINQVSAYQETIQTQEKVIAKMQTIVESKLRSKNALPFLPKQQHPAQSQIPVPGLAQLADLQPPGLPDFEALQAQKVNEEALFQARQEVVELTEKVQDLEHQLFEAKLNQYNHDGSGSDSDSEGEAAESEVRSSSELKEVTEEERARCEDLQSANVKIDELEAENTAKSYRISALEAQLESSTRDYSREIARLRTKLFELEITAAMAGDRPGSSAGDEDYADMDLDLEKLLQVPDPGAPQSTGEVDSKAAQSPGFSPKPSRPPTASKAEQGSRPASAGKAMGDGRSEKGSRPPSGSARAAAVSLKSGAPESPAEPKLSSNGKVSRQPSHVSDIDKLAAAMSTLDTAEKGLTGAATEKTSKSPSSAVSAAPSKEAIPSAAAVADVADGAHTPKSATGSKPTSTDALNPASPGDAAALAKSDSTAAPTDGEDAVPAKGESEESSPAPALKKSASPTGIPTAEGGDPGEKTGGEASALHKRPSAPDQPAAASAEHPHSEESLHRVPKFRKTSVGDVSKHIGHGQEGPQDPDAIDKEIELSIEIIDSDQESPRSEATIRTKKDNKIVLAMLKMTLHCHHDHIRKSTAFKIQRLRLHGYSQELLQNRFDPYLKLSFGGKWECVTSTVKSIAQVSEWAFDTDSGFFDKKFSATDVDLSTPATSTFSCVVKKTNQKGNEDFECGAGRVILTKQLFTE